MKSTNLGAFEEIVLMVIGILGQNAYGVTIIEELEKQTKHRPSVGSLHAALHRLENKGFVESKESGATAERGGRRKRYYKITATGKSTLVKAHELRDVLIKLIPDLGI
ncbi:MAG: helix-turn-helix transcriptional regulator [Cyclobacteriaceae bacterium]